MASAQFGPGYGYGFRYSYNGPPLLSPLPLLPPLQPLPRLAPLPPLNPYLQPPRYTFQYSTHVTNPYSGATLRTQTFYSSISPPIWGYPAFYPQSGQEMYGGASSGSNIALQNQYDLQRAQRTMAAGGYGSSGEKPGGLAVVGTPGGVAMPDGFAKALAPADRARVISGETLNELLKEIVKAEPKGGNRASAFVSVALLDEVRFGGTDGADALNLARRAGNLDFPTAFYDPALKDLRVALDRDFTAVAIALQAGKSPDPSRRSQFEVTLERVEAALGSVAKTLPDEDAATARRFTSQMSNALKAMKAGAGNGLIDPKWSVEGTTVADFVKHMTRHKLQFAAAPSGNEESYMALHRNFATYLFLLTQPRK